MGEHGNIIIYSFVCTFFLFTAYKIQTVLYLGCQYTQSQKFQSYFSSYMKAKCNPPTLGFEFSHEWYKLIPHWQLSHELLYLSNISNPFALWLPSIRCESMASHKRSGYFDLLRYSVINITSIAEVWVLRSVDEWKMSNS
jgi:hypothetical protein